MKPDPARPLPPPVGGGVFASFAKPRFRWLFARDTTFFPAMGGKMVLRSWLVYQLTGSELALGMVSAIVGAPMMLVARSAAPSRSPRPAGAGGGRARIQNAMALNVVAVNTTRVVEPAAAGLLIGLLGLRAVYTINVALYVLGLACLAAVGRRPSRRGGARRLDRSRPARGVA